jgi:[ribosomal protein S5]-alanine N-acetyltransferase
VPDVLPITTSRLTLRRYQRADAEVMIPLIGDRAIAETTARIPHPYTMNDFNFFFDKVSTPGGSTVACITLSADSSLVGTIGLDPNPDNDCVELGYWIGKPFWGHGYATEAAAAMLRVAFEGLGVNRVNAHCFTRNLASARVLEKIGMQREGLLRQHMKRFGKYEDSLAYGITASDYHAKARP